MSKLTQQIVDNAVRKTYEKFGIASISVSAWDGENVWHSACGSANIEKQIPASEKTIYCIGSSSKAITTTALGILIGEGKLELDKPVKTYLPDFEMADPYFTEHVTVRDILCHRTGLPRHDFTLDLRADLSRDGIVELIRYLKPAFPLRYTWSYQNHMFVLAGALVEKLSGMSWEEFIKTRIFEPLGMKSTYSVGAYVPDDLPEKSKPYGKNDNGFKLLPYNYILNFAPAGGVYSDTEDMLKWLRFNIEGDEKILPKKVLDEIHSPMMLIKKGEFSLIDFPEINAHSYGLAWFVFGYRGSVIIHHGGAIDGYRSMQMFMPKENIAVSVLTNSESSAATYAAAYPLFDAMLGEEDPGWNDRMFEAEEKMKEAFVKAEEEFKASVVEGNYCADPAAYVGNYSNEAYGGASITLEDGKLIAHIGQYNLALDYKDNDAFSMSDAELMFRIDVDFVRDEAGAVCGFKLPIEPLLPDDPELFKKVN